MKQLDVYYNSSLAGFLCSSSVGILSFIYDDSWIQHGSALSSELPLTTKNYNDEKIRLFLSNLLPEEMIRQQLTSLLKVDSNNLFDLLHEIGRDCGGAVSFWSHGTQPNDQAKYIPLKDAVWEDWLSSSQEFPLMINPQEDIRLSLAGAQTKTVLYFDNDNAFLCKNGAASTHIIKPPHQWIKSDLVRNELNCLHLAKAMGIDTAETGLWKGCLRITRYDRKEVGGKIKRLHQEDFCQLLGRLPEQKYQSSATPEKLHGLMFEKLNELGEKGLLKIPAVARLSLLDLIIFNVFIWNTDAHLKNYSILYDDKGFCEFAPAYDLISTRKLYLNDKNGKHHNLGAKLAIGIGGERIVSQIKRKNWVKFAAECDLTTKIVFNRIAGFRNKIYARAQTTILSSVASSYGKSKWNGMFLDTLKQQISRAATWLDK